MVIAIDGKAVRGARDKAGKAPHLAAALAHGIGAMLGQAAVTASRTRSPHRGHWELENKLHWVRDVTYQEDKSLVRTGSAPRQGNAAGPGHE
jgi:hypothetical protein